MYYIYPELRIYDCCSGTGKGAGSKQGGAAREHRESTGA